MIQWGFLITISAHTLLHVYFSREMNLVGGPILRLQEKFRGEFDYTLRNFLGFMTFSA